MKLKASHHWRTDGTIVIEIRDHDAKKSMPRKNPFSDNVLAYGMRHPQIAVLVTTMDLPRGTSKDEVKVVKKNLIMAFEAQMNEVSR
jgi:hypothetical protein